MVGQFCFEFFPVLRTEVHGKGSARHEASACPSMHLLRFFELLVPMRLLRASWHEFLSLTNDGRVPVLLFRASWHGLVLLTNEEMLQLQIHKPTHHQHPDL